MSDRPTPRALVAGDAERNGWQVIPGTGATVDAYRRGADTLVYGWRDDNQSAFHVQHNGVPFWGPLALVKAREVMEEPA